MLLGTELLNKLIFQNLFYREQVPLYLNLKTAVI